MMKKIITISLFFVGCVVYSQKSFDLMNEGIYSRNFNPELAISKFDEAISINDFSIPKEIDEINYLARTYFERGCCKEKLEKHYEAMKDFTIAIDICIKSKALNNIDAYYGRRGHLKMFLKDYNGAILDFKKTYYVFSEEKQYFIGKAYYELKNYKEARVRFQKAISLYTSPVTSRGEQYAPSYYYYYLGICELNLNLMTDACNNLRIAGDLGDEDAIKLIVKYCN